MAAGAVGAFFGTPAEISLVRMTADGRLPVNEKRNYTNVFNALFRITKEEGILTLWRGCIPTMGRAMVVNAAQLASYSQAKQILVSTKYFKDNILCHFTASMISGLITTAASMPVDIAKTRIQNMKTVNGKPEYKGAIVRVVLFLYLCVTLSSNFLRSYLGCYNKSRQKRRIFPSVEGIHPLLRSTWSSYSVNICISRTDESLI